MTKTQIIQKYLSILKAEIGTHEVGENRGARVQQYQAATTLGGTGWPWCAALLAHGFKETERALGIKIPWSFSASCDVLWADGRSRGLIRSTPQVGDVFIVKAKKNKSYSSSDGIHTGAVTAVNGNQFKTIEGNTNDNGGREGVAVMEHTRIVSNRFAFIRWIDDVKVAQDVAEKPWRVILESGTKKMDLTAVLINGTNYLAARDFANAMGTVSSWNPDDGQVSIAGRPVESQPRLIEGRAYFPIRVLSDHVGKLVEPHAATRTVIIG